MDFWEFLVLLIVEISVILLNDKVDDLFCLVKELKDEIQKRKI